MLLYRPLSASEQINFLKKIRLYIQQQKYDEAVSLFLLYVNILFSLSWNYLKDKTFFLPYDVHVINLKPHCKS